MAQASFDQETSIVANCSCLQDCARSCTKANASLTFVDLLERILDKGLLLECDGGAPPVVVGLHTGEPPRDLQKL